jgi:hypothetical protein
MPLISCYSEVTKDLPKLFSKKIHCWLAKEICRSIFAAAKEESSDAELDAVVL